MKARKQAFKLCAEFKLSAAILNVSGVCDCILLKQELVLEKGNSRMG